MPWESASSPHALEVSSHLQLRQRPRQRMVGVGRRQPRTRHLGKPSATREPGSEQEAPRHPPPERPSQTLSREESLLLARVALCC